MSTEAVSAENNGLEKTDAQTSASPPHVDVVANMETEVRWANLKTFILCACKI